MPPHSWGAYPLAAICQAHRFFCSATIHFGATTPSPTVHPVFPSCPLPEADRNNTVKVDGKQWKIKGTRRVIYPSWPSPTPPPSLPNK